jgi:branched-chain amino acid transport system ATP-binding protein
MALLAVDNVSVAFGGIQALSGVTLRVEAAQITGLIGPNGAGKSTLLGVLSGLIQPQGGTVSLEGKSLGRLAPHRRARLGMARSFQRLELWGSMTVRENILTAAEFASKWNRELEPPDVTEELIERLSLTPVADTPAAALSSGIARVCEVARALASQPRLLLLDEPSAGLDDFESRELTDTLMAVAAAGTAVLLVEHHVEMVMRSCAHIWVLDFGLLIADGTASEIRASEAVQTAYLGSRHADRA